MINAHIKNHRISSTDKFNDIILNDNALIRAYWKFVEELKKYDGQQLEIKFKCKTAKQIEQKKNDSRQEPHEGSKYNRRKYHGGHAPEMSEYEHILVEKQEIEELEYEWRIIRIKIRVIRKYYDRN